MNDDPLKVDVSSLSWPNNWFAPKLEPDLCSNCGKDMTNYDNPYQKLIGVHISFTTINKTEEGKKQREYLQKQLGRFYKENEEISICMECWMAAIFTNRRPEPML